MNTRRMISALGALALASSAQAAMIGPIFTISAWSQGDTSTFSIDQSMLVPQGSRSDGMEWRLSNPVELLNASGDSLGTIMDASFVTNGTTDRAGEQIVSLGFQVTAGGASTMFTITSGLLEFDPIDPAQGIASAGVSITDLDGTGVEFQGEYDGGAFQARTNGNNGGFTTGTVFDTLLADDTANSFDTSTQNEFSGPTGIPPVSSMQTQFMFTLSANDMAAGTSVFVVSPIPSPGASLLALTACGLVAPRRRR